MMIMITHSETLLCVVISKFAEKNNLKNSHKISPNFARGLICINVSLLNEFIYCKNTCALERK